MDCNGAVKNALIDCFPDEEMVFIHLKLDVPSLDRLFRSDERMKFYEMRIKNSIKFRFPMSRVSLVG